MKRIAKQIGLKRISSLARSKDRICSIWSRIFLVLFQITLLSFLAGCQSPSGSVPTMSITESPADPSMDSPSDLGIEVKGLRLSATGYMLDFRFLVTDPDKASLLFGKGIQNYLVDPESGAKLIVPAPPKVGALRQNSGRPVKNRTYFVMFANPGRFIKPGKKVTVVMGETEIKDVLVQ